MMEENPDAIYVSIHLNKFTTSAANGAQVFYTKKFQEARVLGDCIQQSIVYYLQPENSRVIKQGTDSTYLLKNAAVPAVIVECGFLSNKSELTRLKTKEYQSQLAFSVAMGICDYIGI
jgi:N-acetylmuramoyl-L-alanine amidase